MATAAVAYYRVSSKGQCQSGLGLEAQQKAVSGFARSRGWVLLDPPFTEVESGRKDERAELPKALAKCKAESAILVIAKLDRLTRDLHFLTGLIKAGIEFVAVDLPEANKLTLHIMGAMAEYEREVISARTKAALAAAKRRGIRLGSPVPEKGSRAGVRALKQQSDEFAARTVLVIRGIQASNPRISLRGIAAALEARGISTARGGTWGPSSVRNILLRVSKS